MNFNNPNLLVRNFTEKKGLIFSGELSETKIFTYEKVNRSYVIISVSVKNALDTDFCYIDLTDKNGTYSDLDTKPYLRILSGDSEISTNTQKQIFFRSNGSHVFAADITKNEGFKLHLQKIQGNPTLKVYVTFVDDISNYLIDSIVTDVSYLKTEIGDSFTNSLDLITDKFRFDFIENLQTAWGDYYASADGTRLTIVHDGVKESVLSPDIGFSGDVFIYPMLVPLKRGDQMGIVVKFVTLDKWYFCDVTDASSIYVASNWKPCKFWEKRGTKRKIPVSSSGLVDDYHRLDTTIDPSNYNYDEIKVVNGETYIAYQGEPHLRPLGLPARTKRFTCMGDYVLDGGRCNIWVTTDSGENWVSIYDFVNTSTLKSGSINTSSFPDYTTGLTAHKIVLNTPSSTNKEPVNLYSFVDMTISSITKGSETIIGVNNHGLINGDLVLFSGDAGVEWNQIKSSEYGENTVGDNLYVIQVVDTNRFRLKEYLGSYDANLACRHIHSSNETKSGVIIATGEDYPQSWFLYVEQRQKDEYFSADAFLDIFPVYRLNSSENGIERGAGVLMDSSPDPTIFYNSDTSKSIGRFKIDGRTQEEKLPIVSLNGIWKGKLSQIDDITKWECVLPLPEPGIWMFQLGKVIIGYGMLDGIFISLDSGETFEYFPTGGSRFINGVYKGRIVISNGYRMVLR